MLLTVLVGVTVAAFLGTRAVAHSNEALHRRQAAVSFQAAQLASRGGNPATAIAALHRAVLKDPENKRYRLALAEALAASRLDEEATHVLRALRDAQPEDPDTNLQLARLEARGTDAEAARRYYQNALAGLWRPEQAEDRRLVRIELIGFLLAHEQRARALSELLVLSQLCRRMQASRHTWDGCSSPPAIRGWRWITSCARFVWILKALTLSPAPVKRLSTLRTTAGLSAF
jgi:tetratricopeptide (TPR) repeat protein